MTRKGWLGRSLGWQGLRRRELTGAPRRNHVLDRLRLERLEDRTLPSTFLVTTTADSGPGSLRQAILDANANQGADLIRFDIGSGGLQTIAPLSALPPITDPVTIDATTQPGYAGTPIIELNGSGAGLGVSGLKITTFNSTVRGLVIDNFSGDGIDLTGSGAVGNVIEGNYVGTNVYGTLASANLVHGISISNGAANNTIGGTSAAHRNIISGNGGDGLLITGLGTTGNVVEGNYVGVDISGNAGLPNYSYGVDIETSQNILGGTVAGAGNVISAGGGVNIDGDDNLVAGNMIGLTAAGTAALGNGDFNLVVTGVRNTIGGTVAAARNVISAAINLGGGEGIEVVLSHAVGTLFEGNYIGTDASGNNAVVNSYNVGMEVDGGLDNTIGGTTSGARNLFAGHLGNWQLRLENGATGTVIQGNFFGTNSTGTALNNPNGAIAIYGSFNTTVGGTVSGAGNLIESGMNIGLGSTNNLVEGNLFNTDVTGTQVLGAGYEGILINGGSTGNTVGGTTPATRNIIAGNTRPLSVLPAGVCISGSTTTDNLVEGNYIGTDVTGTVALGNYDGVVIDDSPNNTIGGTARGAGNLISGNTRFGVFITYSNATGNVVAGNRIGTNAAGTAALANASDGILIYSGAANNTIGGTAPGAGNVISGNGRHGVDMYSPGTTGNAVQGNDIGTDFTGNVALGNQNDGVMVQMGASNNTIGGPLLGSGNVIAGNAGDGMQISGADVTGNLVAGNYIGTNATSSGGPARTGTVSWFRGEFNANDSVGKNPGTLTNVSFVGGRVGYGFSINGPNSYVTVPDSPSLRPTRVSLEAWVQPLDTGVYETLVTKEPLSNSGQLGYGLRQRADNHFAFSIGEEGSSLIFIESTTTLVPGQWYHLVGTYDGITASLYVNGNLEAVNTGLGIISSTAPLTIGRLNTGGEQFHGLIDEVSVFNRVLSSSEVQAVYLAGAAGKPDFVSNGGNGITITGSANNTIGGPPPAWRNIISANNGDGIQITGGAGGNVIAGNLIGTDGTGTRALANGGNGVTIANSPNNMIGLTTPIAGNVISGNGGFGVVIRGSAATGNVLQGNLIGPGLGSAGLLGNQVGGLFVVDFAASNLIGGTSGFISRNIISGNHGHGIDLALSAGANTVEGNYIGIGGTTGIGGTEPGIMPNDGVGILIRSSPNNTIGGTTILAGNVVSGNTAGGLEIAGDGSTGNLVEGNDIGTDPTGTQAVIGPGYSLLLPGVLITYSAAFNTIGGTTAGARNLISGNAGEGIDISAGATGNLIEGNYVGTDVTGTAALANAGNGVSFANSPSNVISGNLISGNTASGVLISGNSTPAGTISLWRAEGNVKDSLGSNSGTWVGPDNYVAARSGEGLNFKGTNYLQIPASSSLDVSQLAVAGWIKPSFAGRPFQNGDVDVIFQKFSGSAGYMLGDAMDPAWRFVNAPAGGAPLGTPFFTLVINNALYQIFGSSPMPNDGNYHFVAGTYDGASMNLYLDGALVASLAVTGTITTATGTPAFIGHENSFPRNSQASIDEVIVASQAFSASQIQGMTLAGGFGTLVEGNMIGTNVTGRAALSNGGDGVTVSNSVDNTIGVVRNLISGNTGNGIQIVGSAATGNVVADNYIGTDINGSGNLAPNGMISWYVEGNSKDYVGNNPATLHNLGQAQGVIIIGDASYFNTNLYDFAYSFNGAGAYDSIPDSASLRPRQVSLEAWVKPLDTGSSEALVTKEPLPGSRQVGYGLRQLADNHFAFVLGGEGTSLVSIESTTTIVPGTWYYLVLNEAKPPMVGGRIS